MKLRSAAFQRQLAGRFALLFGACGALAVAGSGACHVFGGGGGGGGTPVEDIRCVFHGPDDAGLDGACPATESVDVLPQGICEQDVVVEGLADGGESDAGPQCCYLVRATEFQSCTTGRPYLVAGRSQRAGEGRGEGWRGQLASVQTEGLSERAKQALARAWTRDGLYEHASIASFGRFAFELLSVGAPAELVASAHLAALDEVEHARVSLELARAYGGEPVAPAAFDFGGRVELASTLEDIATSAVIEGCVGETLAALRAAEAAEHAVDPVVRGVLEAIAEDESRHAELAWRFVAWAVNRGGDVVREAVARAFDRATRGLTVDGELDGLLAHGRLDRETTERVIARGVADVVLPSAGRLLRQSEDPRALVAPEAQS